MWLLIISLLLFVYVSSGTSSEYTTKESIPNPMDNPVRCGNTGSTRICDPDNILRNTTYADIEREFVKIDNIAVCPCPTCYGGYGGSLLILNDTQELDRDDRDDRKYYVGRDYTRYLRDNGWSNGNCDDDFIILVVIQDSLIYTLAAPNTADLLYTACLRDIYWRHSPMFTSGEYDEAIVALVEDHWTYLTYNQTCGIHQNSTDAIDENGDTGLVNSVIIIAILVPIVIVIVLLCILWKVFCSGGSSSGGRTGNGGGGIDFEIGGGDFGGGDFGGD